MHYLGVDIGTSGAKAVAFDAQGRVQAAAAREYPLHHPRPGWTELDSAEVLRRCLEAIAEVCGRLVPGSVRALGISSQGEAFTPVAADGTPLGRGMTSSDQRAVDYVRDFPAAFGGERLYAITGHTAHPMHSLFKLLWLRDHQPEVWRAAARFLCYEDLLAARLGVPPAMGWPLAGRTMLFDVVRHRWDPELLAATGLTPERLARPLAAGSVSGSVAAAVARELGLGAGCLVVTGGHDQCCGALGAGVLAPGLAMYATGSVEAIAPALPGPVFTPALRAANLATYDHAAPGAYATVAFSLTGGNLLRWWRDEFGHDECRRAAATGRSPYELLLEPLPDTPSSVIALPYCTTSGTPYFDARVGGAILGLRLTTTRPDLLRGLLEGVVLEMRLNLDILHESGCPVHELRLIGGGARSPRWNQLRADVLGRPLDVLDVTEAGCLGVAMLACAADTGAPLADLARAWVRPVARVAPRPAFADWYATRAAHYRQLYPTLRPLALHDAGPPPAG